MTLQMLRQRPYARTVVNRPRFEIIQRWVETADERCPLACVWLPCPKPFRTRTTSATYYGLPSPRFRLEAGYLHVIHISPAPSILAPLLKNSIQTIAALVLLMAGMSAGAHNRSWQMTAPSSCLRPPVPDG
ncbi:MAG: hypothetical protein WDN23_10695 [Edaphobacter sp.]